MIINVNIDVFSSIEKLINRIMSVKKDKALDDWVKSTPIEPYKR